LSAGRVTCAGLAADQVFHFQCSNWKRSQISGFRKATPLIGAQPGK
jgi:hypothetical protein